MNAEHAVLVVHGGAGSLASQADRDAYLLGVRGALAAGRSLLATSAREAVLAAVAHLEAKTITNAGKGAALARDGRAWLDAGFMSGAKRRYGSVTGVHNCMNPVLLAAKLSDEGDFGRFVGPPDSDQLTSELGVPGCAQGDLITERTQRLFEERTAAAAAGANFLDTVGAVALDAQGRLAAAVSTGGMSLKRAGRIGDSPVVGGGFWADDRVGACVTTGVGEALMREGTARRAVQLIGAGGAPASAGAQALSELLDHDGDTRGCSGLILIDTKGAVVLDHNTPEMSGGWTRLDESGEVTHLWRTS